MTIVTTVIGACTASSTPSSAPKGSGGTPGGAGGSGGSPGGTGGNGGTSAAAGSGGGSALGGSPGNGGSGGGNPGNPATGGAGGSASGDAGANPAADGGGDSGGATPPAQMSAGCNKTPAIAKGQFVSAPLMGRTTWTRLPANYDPSKPYPVVFVWKGCGGGGVGAFGMDTVAGNEAIIAQGDFPPGASCYDTADGAKFVDLPLFDALLDQISSNHCVDRTRLYSVGFSSGAWLTFFLACQRGDVLRGIGTVAGGHKPTFLLGMPQCKGNGLAAMMVSDLDDHENPFFDEDNDGDGVEIGVNHWLGINGCTEKAWTMQAGTATEPDPNVCRSYTGCRHPLKLCLTKGKGHSGQESLSFPGFWQLFKQTPAK